MKRISKINLTSSPWGFRETDFELQCKWLKAQNINHVCGQFFDASGLFSLKSNKDSILGKLEIARKYNLKFASINANGDFMMNNLEAETDKCCHDIDLASHLSPEVIVVFAGWQNRRDSEVYNQVSRGLKKVAQHAARYGLTIALENHGGLTATSEQVNRILDGVNEPNIGLNYDPANFLLYGDDFSNQPEEPKNADFPLQALKDINHPIVFTHFKSVKYVDGKKAFCRLNEGVIDYLPILKYLNGTYDGFYAAEYEETGDVFNGTKDDLNELKRLMAKI